MKRIRVQFEYRDLWVGVFVGAGYVYVCIVPMVVIRWARKGWPR